MGKEDPRNSGNDDEGSGYWLYGVWISAADAKTLALSDYPMDAGIQSESIPPDLRVVFDLKDEP